MKWLKKSDKSDIESKYILLGDNVTYSYNAGGEYSIMQHLQKDVVAGFNVNVGDTPYLTLVRCITTI